MTYKQIIIDDYFTECTDEGGGTIGYHLISETALIKKIREQNEYIKTKEQECEELEKKIENYCFDCDVAERMRKVTYAATGGRLSYANYTVEAIEQAYNDQLRIDVEYRTKELEEELEQYKNVVNKLAGMQVILTNEEKMPMLYENAKDLKLKQLSKTLTEIEEYLKPYICRGGVEPQWVEWQMAQREKEKMAKDILKILQKQKVVLNDVIGEQK